MQPIGFSLISKGKKLVNSKYMLIAQMVAYMSEVCMKVHILCVVLKNVMQNNDKTMIKQGLLQYIVRANFKYKWKTICCISAVLNIGSNTGPHPVDLRSWVLNLMFSRNLYSENCYF